jgi:Protein of unknown function (DUF2946)
MTKRGKKRQAWVAVLATFVLFLHTLVAGFVDGAMAAPEYRDAFGGVICSHFDSKGPGDSNDPRGHSPLPPCCLVGCNLVGGHATVAVAPAFAVWIPPLWLSAERSASDAPRVGDSSFSPLNARAPPPA